MEQVVDASARTPQPVRAAAPGVAAGVATAALGRRVVAGRRDTGAAAQGALWRSLLGGTALAAPEIEALSAECRWRELAAGQWVFQHTQPATALVALRQGEVALGLCMQDGTFRTERIVRGPAWLDLGSGWLESKHAMDARAGTAAAVVELPRAAVVMAIRQHPGLALRMVQALAREVSALAANTHELMHKDAPARLAHWLVQRCETPADAGGQTVVRLRERKRDVASQLAITPETLSRLMRSFTRRGLIEVAGYTVHVLDAQALGELAVA